MDYVLLLVGSMQGSGPPSAFMRLQNHFEVELLCMQELCTAPQCTKKNAADPGFPKPTFVLEDVQLVARDVHKDAAGEAMPGHSCSLLLMSRLSCTEQQMHDRSWLSLTCAQCVNAFVGSVKAVVNLLYSKQQAFTLFP